jgi:hypothetical protein
MGIAGRRRAEERYSLKVAAPQLISMLRQIAGAENIADTGGTASEPAPIGGHLG